MSLSSELISQFAKITNGSNNKTRTEEVTLYGTVLEYEDSICVKFDGASEITPVTTISDKDEDGNATNYRYGSASVSAGDRVSVLLKNHSATITGNLSNPSVGNTEMLVLEDSIVAKINGDVKMEIDKLGVTVNGILTVTNGLEDGTTTIDGACIKTGKIEAEHLNLTGAISFGDLTDADEVQEDINNAQTTANNAQSVAANAQSTANSAVTTANSANVIASATNNVVSGWTYSGSTYIDGSKIYTGTVRASYLQGGEVQLWDYYGNVVGWFSLSSTTSGTGVQLTSVAGMQLYAGGNMFFQSASGAWLQLTDAVTCRAVFMPSSNGVYSLGNSSFKWSDLYCANGTIVTSDATVKTNISYDLDRYDKFFDALAPCSFEFVDGTSGRTHLGMISQDVEIELTESELSDIDFAGFIKSPREGADGGYDYALRYTEFIPLLIRQVQKLKARVAELEEANG